MTAAAAARPFPDSRVLEAWWRRLSAAGAAGLWIAHLLLHRVEAAVRAKASARLERVPRLLLQALGAGATSADVAGRLALPAHLADHLLRTLAADGLAARNARGLWSITPAGVEACAGIAATKVERRVFHFCETAPAGAPQFLDLRAPAEPCDPPPGWHFDLAWLADCVSRTSAWKGACGFPADVQEVLTAHSAPRDEPAGELAWGLVPLDTPARLSAAVAWFPGGRLVGHAVQPTAWILSDAIAFDLRPPCAAALAEEPPPAAWRQALRDWGRTAGLPAASLDGCRTERVGHRLRVQAPAAVIDRLRRRRTGAAGDWLLAGGPRVRAAARLEFSRLP